MRVSLTREEADALRESIRHSLLRLSEATGKYGSIPGYCEQNQQQRAILGRVNHKLRGAK